MIHYIDYGPGPRRHPFGIPFVKKFMCLYFFPYGGGVEPGPPRARKPEKGENHRSGVVKCKNGPK